MTTWTHQRGAPTHLTECGRACVEKIGSRYEVTVDGEKLSYGKSVRKPYRYEKLAEAKSAAAEKLETGEFSTPTRRELRYATYDPAVEGYGSAAQWQAIFAAALGAGGELETEELVAQLGLKTTASWDDIKRAYRKQLLRLHPDQGGDPAEFRAAVEAFQQLEARHRVQQASAPSQG